MRIIHGDVLLDPKEAGGEFVLAEATNTRLMGVVGIRIRRRTDSGFRDQLFYLDTEEYGLDDYESFKEDSTTEDVEMAIKRLFGGLGGHRVPISEKSAIYLICQASTLNIKNDIPLPDGIDEYAPILNSPVKLDPDEYSSLMGTICESPANDMGLVNYYIMRAVGLDSEAVSYLESPEGNFQRIELTEPGTLHRNDIEPVQPLGESSKSIKEYFSTSLIEDEKGYRLLRSKLETLGPKVISFSIISDMEVTGWEATNILRKDEFISYFRVGPHMIPLIREWIERYHRDATVNDHPGGILYMLFHPNNNHVNRRIYRLDNDVEVNIYTKHNGEMLIAGASAHLVERAEADIVTSLRLSASDMTDKSRYIFTEPVLGLFLLGDDEIYDSFLDFLQIFTSKGNE